VLAMQDVLGSHCGACIIDGTWFKDLEDEEMAEEVRTARSLQNLFTKAQRIPDLTVILRCKHDFAAKNTFNFEAIDKVHQERVAEYKKRVARPRRRRRTFLSRLRVWLLTKIVKRKNQIGSRPSSLRRRQRNSSRSRTCQKLLWQPAPLYRRWRLSGATRPRTKLYDGIADRSLSREPAFCCSSKSPRPLPVKLQTSRDAALLESRASRVPIRCFWTPRLILAGARH